LTETAAGVVEQKSHVASGSSIVDNDADDDDVLVAFHDALVDNDIVLFFLLLFLSFFCTAVFNVHCEFGIVVIITVVSFLCYLKASSFVGCDSKIVQRFFH
jgi:hypothetical protein